MKKALLSVLLLMTTVLIYGQTTYYWVGGTTPTTSVTTGSNWNTSLDGLGTARPSATGATDILVFNGTNVGGATPATGAVTVLVNGSITCAQIKIINGANISFIRASSGTSTVTLNGEAGEDFVIEAGASLSLTSTVGSIRMAMAASCTGRVSGALTLVTPLQARFDNTTAGTPGSFIFTSGSSLTTNITSASSSYAFGSSTQSSEKWVVFEAGSHIYYDGGFSPSGSGANYSAIDMKPGSTWHHRATNPTTNAGNFFNRKNFGNVIVENNANLIALGTVYSIGNLTINSGSTFTTASAGQTVILGQLVVNGSLVSDAASTNELVFAGNTSQSITGAGTINVASLIVADNADVTMNGNISVDKNVNIYGKLNFITHQLTGNSTFAAKGANLPVSGTGNLVGGSFMITGNTSIPASSRGMEIAGAGIAPNTSIVAFSTTSDSIFISNPIAASATGVILSVAANGAVLETSNANGFDPASGSAATTGTKTYEDRISYIIHSATISPFGFTTGAPASSLILKFAEIHAPVTFTSSAQILHHLTVNGKITLPAGNTIHILPAAVINGTFNASNYIATGANTTSGEQGIVRYDGIAAATTVPIGTSNYYLPVVLTPTSSSNFTLATFEGITANGAVNGAALTPSEKQTVVNAVWNINRLSGAGSVDVQLGWNNALEGSTFTTLPNTDIGVIYNTGGSWGLPLGPGDNVLNTAVAATGSLGAFSAGAVPQVQPFVFNPLPAKVYGDADFNGGATSLNTTQPIVYTTDNAAVATIVGGNIHITGAGTANITASQASDGFYPAASASQPLTVSKAALTITADNKLKFQGQANPTLTVTYTGFVLGETSTVLLTQPVITTTAVTASPAGTYPITVSGATAANYDITMVNGTLTVQPQQSQTITFNPLPTKTYGNADFPTGATSTNSTIPITYVSSNPAVATVTGNIIHITGGGTTTITASQAGNAGYFPAADVSRVLTVNKAPLSIRVLDTVKLQGQPNPSFTFSAIGFVLGETPTNLTTLPTVSTTATTTSPAGYYTLTPEGATSPNYNIVYTAGRLTIYPPGGKTESYIHAYMSTPTTLTVRVYSTFPALGDVVLYDISGKPLLKKNIFLPQGFISTNIPVPTTPSGVYVVTVRTSEGTELKKMIPIIR